MMNKSSSRLIAILMTVMMIFNIAPVSAFAEGGQTPSGETSAIDMEMADGYQVVGSVGTDEVPGENQTFDVQYVVRGDFTYSGKTLLIDTESGVT